MWVGHIYLWITATVVVRWSAGQNAVSGTGRPAGGLRELREPEALHSV